MDDPLRLPNQELVAAWDAVHRMRKTEQFEEIESNYRSVLNHLEKLWIKTERCCTQFGAGFSSWQSKYRELRSSDRLLQYFAQSRHVDNHTAQDISYLVVGHLQLFPRTSFSLSDNSVPAVDTVINRGVSYLPPDSHLGEQLHTKDPRVLCVYACNFYADYLSDVRDQFFPAAP